MLFLRTLRFLLNHNFINKDVGRITYSFYPFRQISIVTSNNFYIAGVSIYISRNILNCWRQFWIGNFTFCFSNKRKVLTIVAGIELNLARHHNPRTSILKQSCSNSANRHFCAKIYYSLKVLSLVAMPST